VRDTSQAARGELTITPPHRELLDQVLDKWSLAVLGELCERPSRFNDLRRAIPAVTQKSLTATLRRLERNGIVERELLSSRPVAVEYRITPLGKTLRHPVDALLGWAETHMPQIENARARFDTEPEPS
jgi:DNA-binding HxlR family transcriptional regulator